MNLLIVDNQDVLRKGLTELVRNSVDTAVISEAKDGLAALSVAKASPPQLAILDIHMPHLDGIATARQLLSAHPELKIVFLTIHSDSETVRAAFDAGASGYVLKDDDVDVLLEAIRTVSDGHTFLSPQLSDTGEALTAAANHANKHTALSGILTKRQIEVLTLLATGLSVREIASKTGLSTKTLDSHRRHIQKRLDIHTTADLTRLAIREGLVDLDGVASNADHNAD